MGEPSPKLSTGMCRSVCSCRMTSFTSWTPPRLAQGMLDSSGFVLPAACLYDMSFLYLSHTLSP